MIKIFYTGKYVSKLMVFFFTFKRINVNRGVMQAIDLVIIWIKWLSSFSSFTCQTIKYLSTSFYLSFFSHSSNLSRHPFYHIRDLFLTSLVSQTYSWDMLWGLLYIYFSFILVFVFWFFFLTLTSCLYICNLSFTFFFFN